MTVLGHDWHASVYPSKNYSSYARTVKAALQDDDNKSFTAIWVFKPSEKSFKVYQEFSILANSPNSNQQFMLERPQGGYSTEQFFAKIPGDS